MMELVQRSWSYVMHENGGYRTAELSSNDVTICSPQDFLDIMGDLRAHEIDELVLDERNMTPAFFELSTGLAGEILQKSSNYGLRLALTGDFSRYKSESLRAFIRESNRGRSIFFVKTVEEALDALKNSRELE